jgi:hypothetical protein
MIKLRCVALLLMLLPLLLLTAAPPLAAQSLHHAALIVDFGDGRGDGRVVVRVVAFTGETLSGVALLQQSGLDAAVMINPGGGAALCAVEGVGCAPTPQECFCQCRGTPCRYWSYFHFQDGDWVYAGMGAADHLLRDGDVDGWIWGDGRTPPPLLTWDEIWAQSAAAQPTAPLPLPTATPLPPATAVPAPATAATVSAPTHTPGTDTSPAPAATSPATPAQAQASATPTAGRTITGTVPTIATPSPVLQATPSPVSPSPPATAPTGVEIRWGPLAAFGGLVLLLVLLGLWVRRRK